MKIEKRKRPKLLKGSTIKIETGCGNLFVTVNFNGNNEPFEVFTTIGKAGGCAASQLESIGRLVSLSLRLGAPAEEVVRQLHGIHCHRPFGLGEVHVSSCADGVAKAIRIACLDGNIYKNQEKSSNGKILVDQDKSPGNIIPNNQEKSPAVKITGNQESNYLKIPVSSSNLYSKKLSGFINTPCPDCGAILEFKEGCVICTGCGYSECS